MVPLIPRPPPPKTPAVHEYKTSPASGGTSSGPVSRSTYCTGNTGSELSIFTRAFSGMPVELSRTVWFADAAAARFSGSAGAGESENGEPAGSTVIALTATDTPPHAVMVNERSLVVPFGTGP